MKIIGLTGSIGMGKTTTANMLRTMGIPVHDSDAAVHALLAPGGAGVNAVIAHFPSAYDRASGGINRRALRLAAGHDNTQWDLLEKILHPLVQDAQQTFLHEQQVKGVAIAALDIPLLFETGAERRVDFIICVTCPAFLQRQRVLSRDGMSEEDFNFRLSRQMPDAEKCRRADFVVQTGLGQAYTYKEIEQIVVKIKGNPPTHESRYFPS